MRMISTAECRKDVRSNDVNAEEAPKARVEGGGADNQLSKSWLISCYEFVDCLDSLLNKVVVYADFIEKAQNFNQ